MSPSPPERDQPDPEQAGREQAGPAFTPHDGADRSDAFEPAPGATTKPSAGPGQPEPEQPYDQQLPPSYPDAGPPAGSGHGSFGEAGGGTSASGPYGSGGYGPGGYGTDAYGAGAGAAGGQPSAGASQPGWGPGPQGYPGSQPPPATGAPQSWPGGYPVAGGQPPVSESDERTWAVLSHVSIPFAGFVLPLIGYLMYKDRSRWLAEATREALNFSITYCAALLVASLLTGLLVGFVLMPLVFFGGIVLCVLATIAASKHEQYRYPVSWRLVK